MQLPPSTIPDPNVTQPEDWDSSPMIDDPNAPAVRPADWDERPTIDDPSVERPADWDDAEDGEWITPQIPNPECVS